MTGNERREKLLQMLTDSEEPLSGRALAGALGVSRQVIVQDIALLRASDHHISPTSSGYLLTKKDKVSRVFKVFHKAGQTLDELTTFIDYGGTVEDVFIYHKVYGTVRAELNISTKKDIDNFISDLSSGKSGLLSDCTSGYHYHTVSAPTEKLLDLIQKELAVKGYLAKLQDYEPVDFWEAK